MIRRLATLAPWKRRLLAGVAGALLGLAALAGLVLPSRIALARLRDEFVAAHKADDFERLAALFDWEGLAASERGRLKLGLKEGLSLRIRAARLAPLGDEDRALVPAAKPVCRLVVAYEGETGAGVATWIVGETKAGCRIVVRAAPESPKSASGN